VQALDNLLANSMKYGDGTATLTIRDAPECVVISVHNQGQPIAEETRQTLFDPLRRTDERTGGVGLGLYIVDQIVRAHQGQLAFESNDTEGTTFTVTLPKTG
jgi:signal transduction histidine kinase